MNKEGEQPAEDVARLPRTQPPTVSMKEPDLGEFCSATYLRAAASAGGGGGGPERLQPGFPTSRGKREKEKKRDANQKESVLNTGERTWPRKRKK